MGDLSAAGAPDPVRDAARRRPGKTALIAGDTALTWAELDSRVDRAARLLAAQATPGDRVAIILGNTELDGDGPPLATPGPAAEDLAVLLYTSGTSGRPKGAMLTHRALAANNEQLSRIEPPVLGADDVVLLAIPFFHAYGLNTGLGAMAHHGACGVLVDRFDPAETVALIAEHQVTAVIGVPSRYAAWSLVPDVELGRVRTAVCGAAPLDPDVAARFTAATGKTS